MHVQFISGNLLILINLDSVICEVLRFNFLISI